MRTLFCLPLLALLVSACDNPPPPLPVPPDPVAGYAVGMDETGQTYTKPQFEGFKFPRSTQPLRDFATKPATGTFGTQTAAVSGQIPWALPGNWGINRAQVPDSTSYPWDTVLYIPLSNGGTCSGVMIGPFTAITAAHCFFSRTTNTWVAHPTKIGIGANNGFPFGTIVGNWTVWVPSQFDGTANYDIAMIDLRAVDGCPGNCDWLTMANWDWPGVDSFYQSQAALDTVYVARAGYDLDFNQDQTRPRMLFGMGMLFSDCYLMGSCNTGSATVSAGPGDAGAPAFIVAGPGGMGLWYGELFGILAATRQPAAQQPCPTCSSDLCTAIGMTTGTTPNFLCRMDNSSINGLLPDLSPDHGPPDEFTMFRGWTADFVHSIDNSWPWQ